MLINLKPVTTILYGGYNWFWRKTTVKKYLLYRIYIIDEAETVTQCYLH